MDSKALAKSKRAHSLHHSKKPPHSVKSKAQSGGVNNVGSGNKALGKQAKEKARQSELPSNWDRYEEEFDSGFDDPSGDSINKGSDVILPRSKGADFSHLIAEAQSQCQSNSHLDTFPSFDDIFPGDFERGVGSLLSVRGESILSWVGDDNFVVDNETTAVPEASFLSLNLNSLAEQLAKVDISKRLFIEADLLSSELADKGPNASSSAEIDQMQTSETEVTVKISEELALKDFSENTEVISSESTVNGHPNLISQTKGYLNSSQDVETSQTGTSEVSVNPTKKLSTFEATAAEAELDMLLDSFSRTELLDSSGFKSGTFPVSGKQATSQHNRKAPSSSFSKTAVANLDDALDDLLDETSNLSDNNSNKNSSYQLGKATMAAPIAIQSSTSSQTVTKSKVLDDIDSWLDTI